jgi:phosphatidylglycerophosphate synthase
MSTMAATGREPKGTYQDATREMNGWTARAEKRLLLRIAAALPDRVTPDHLTVLGLAGMLLTGAAYAFSARHAALLHLASLGLLLNWFGDSLDGTLARHRAKLRPRYGFYVDHVIDAFGAAAVLGGLAVSGLMSPVLAVVLLVTYLLYSVHMYLQTHVLGRFWLSFGKVGGTELRIILIAVNLAVFAWPAVPVAGVTIRLLDVVCAAGGIGLACALAIAVARTTRELYRLERV